MSGTHSGSGRLRAVLSCALACATLLGCDGIVNHDIPSDWGLTISSARQLTRGGGKTFFIARERTVVSIDDKGGLAHLIGDRKGDIGHITSDEQAVYWTLSLKWKILRAPVDGGQVPRILVEREAAGPIAVNATHLFYSWRKRILRVPKAGSKPETVVESPGRVRAADDAWVYFVHDDVLERAPAGGGAKTTLARGHKFHEVAVDSSHVYWIDRGDRASSQGGSGRLLRVPKKGGPEQVLSAKEVNPACLDIDQDRIWFCNGLHNTSAGAVTSPPMISSIAKTGGPVMRRTMPYQLHSLVVDRNWIYLSEFPGGARVRRIPK